MAVEIKITAATVRDIAPLAHRLIAARAARDDSVLAKETADVLDEITQGADLGAVAERVAALIIALAVAADLVAAAAERLLQTLADAKVDRRSLLLDCMESLDGALADAAAWQAERREDSPG
jgi:hypothetical protein